MKHRGDRRCNKWQKKGTYISELKFIKSSGGNYYDTKSPL